VEFTIKELAERVSRIVGGDVRTVYRPLPQDDPTQRQPDISRAREWLGWAPTIQLEEGLQKTVEYFRGRLGKELRKKRVAGLDQPSGADAD
jgi:Nucleoside-diphosphate-sugar epimerases